MDRRSTNREESPAAGRSGKHRPRGAFSRVSHVYRRLWFRVLAVGFLFIALLEISYLAYPNPNLVPAIIVYCAFLVPVTFMVHLDDRLEATQMPVAVIVIIFISSGAVSLAFASTVELALFPPLGFLQYLFVGPVEETAKIIVPLAFFFVGTYRSVGVGVMIGLVSAMAFSALETSGYAFNAFLGPLDGNATGRVADLFKSPLNVVLLDGSVLFRSLLDPLGHGTWTMLICFGLWNERRKAGRAVFNGRVLGAFVLAMLLHSSWDTVLSFPSSPIWGKVLAWFAFAVTAGFTLWLMERIILKTREAVGGESEETSAGPLPPTG
ncbi:MAG TPA: PrsW family glutamic-type intramembrane protease [Rubrobacter sp.]|nr:PrsW family glutamic-type intramembrane protease [Rubrobacter sp.]